MVAVAQRILSPRPANKALIPYSIRLRTALMEGGLITRDAWSIAETRAEVLQMPVAHVLAARGWVPPETLQRLECRLWNTRKLKSTELHSDARQINALGEDFCRSHKCLPMGNAGTRRRVAFAYGDDIAKYSNEITGCLGHFQPVFAPAEAIDLALDRFSCSSVITKAEQLVPTTESSRSMNAARLAMAFLALGVALSLAMAQAPNITFAAICALAILILVCNTALKLCALVAWHKSKANRAVPTEACAALANPDVALPIVTVLVPLFEEKHIASRLVERLGRLTYPAECLDIALVIEECDHITKRTLATLDLPHTLRLIIVPDGPVKTKPRALNYALTQARGTIIGIYDAEDAPAPDQVEHVITKFQSEGPDLACVQGVLDFYNPRKNWIARCFTVDYATWFRVVLPGYQQMGLPIPLGGTTLFFRREALEDVHAWDAHNVTEDADLGMRLYRKGYRTALITSVTEEEANCRFWPWVKQRSRWIKGYAITYLVHMRRPRQLWRDLGARGFCGLQMIFLGNILGALLAPFLMSFWLITLGFAHPVTVVFAASVLTGLLALFVSAELLTMALGIIAVSGPQHKWLRPWVPTLHFYFPLQSLAAYKAFYELMFKPFYWDKTEHGVE